MGALHTNFVSGTLSSGIGNSDTSMDGAGFADLPVVSGSDHVKIILDPFGEDGAPETVYATGHTASATTLTGLLRGQETSLHSGAPRSHDAGTLWIHAPTAGDWNDALANLSSVLNSPGTALATAAPSALVVGGPNVAGTSPAVPHADHRHGLTAGTPGGAAPGDAAAAGSEDSVARGDHKHAMFPWATDLADVGAAESGGSADSYARGDHAHKIGAGAINLPSQYGGAVRPMLVATSATLPTGQPVGTQVFTTDTQRVATLVATGPDVWTYDVRKMPFGMVTRTGNINPVTSPNETKLTGFVSAETAFRMTYTSTGLTIVEAGLYKVGALVGFASVTGSTNMFRLAAIWLNDSPMTPVNLSAAGDAQGSGTAGHGYSPGTIEAPKRLAVGNTLSVWVRHNYTSAIAVSCLLWAEKIRD